VYKVSSTTFGTGSNVTGFYITDDGNRVCTTPGTTIGLTFTRNYVLNVKAFITCLHSNINGLKPWLRVAMEYYKRGLKEQFLDILTMFSSPGLFQKGSIDEEIQAWRRKYLSILFSF
jgi:hypothetical protein